ncbi:MAG: hypothetical protein QOE96_3795 [Blastocatellia bacterium]|nr:hypothetical protein [Blastocatellia bacterium]
MKIKALAVVEILLFAGIAVGQIPGGSSARDIQTETQKTDPRVEQALERANDHFRKGKLDLEDNKREQARDEFDKAIDEILMSGLDVRANQRLQTGYLELVEKIYREEVPLIRSASQQDVKSASQNQIGFRQQPLRLSSINPPSESVSTENATLKAEQEPCTLGIEKAPAIRGIRLGMTLSEVKALYPGVSEPKERDEVGSSLTIHRPGVDTNDERLKGIDYLALHFFGGRLYVIGVSYKEPSYWQEVTELTKSMGLPNNEDYAQVECRGFSASIFRHSDKTLTLDLTNTLVLKKIIALSNEMKENSADCQISPTLRGIGLGMALTKFRTLYPRSREVRNRPEVGELILHDINASNVRLNGVTDLWLYFLDGKLYFFAIDYSNQIQWKSLDQFVEQFSKGVGLRTKWEGEYTETRTLLCHSFAAVATIKDGHPRIAIQDRAATAKLSQREERLKSPASFRP